MTSVSVSRTIKAPVSEVWDAFTDIGAATGRISGIDAIEVLEGESFDVGYRWRETRTMLGKAATEEMWVTVCEPEVAYEVAAESHGTKYLSRYQFTPDGDSTTVDMTFTGTPVSTVARVMSTLTGWLAKGSVERMLVKDMDELAAFCESAPE